MAGHPIAEDHCHVSAPLVGGTLGDANFNPGGQWDPDKVRKIHVDCPNQISLPRRAYVGTPLASPRYLFGVTSRRGSPAGFSPSSLTLKMVRGARVTTASPLLYLSQCVN